MRQFIKQSGCPTAQTLVAYQADALPILARQAVSAHLLSCEFCAAEAQLLAAHTPQPSAETAPPPVPFALLALAESMLGGIPRAEDRRQRRAA
ncbi:MAG: hypothetical protein ACJ74W_10250 [Pyrinomonadaceae bacterium]